MFIDTNLLIFFAYMLMEKETVHPSFSFNILTHLFYLHFVNIPFHIFMIANWNIFLRKKEVQKINCLNIDLIRRKDWSSYRGRFKMCNFLKNCHFLYLGKKSVFFVTLKLLFEKLSIPPGTLPWFAKFKRKCAILRILCTFEVWLLY